MSNKLFPRSVACKSPKFSDHRGRTWDCCKIFDTQGNEIKGWLDTSWSFYFYFMDKNFMWRKAKINSFDNNELVFDFRKVGKLDYKMDFVPDNKEKVV